MPLTGTRNLASLAATAPVVAGLDAAQWQLEGAQILQLMYEIDDDAMVSLIPPALHPTIPPTVVFTVTRVPDSPVGPYVLAEARVGCRSGARPRGFLARGYCDSNHAIGALSSTWGYPLTHAEVMLEKRYDRINAEVRTGGQTLLAASLMNPEPVSGNDIQYLASLNLARVQRNGSQETRLIQVDPDYTFRSADRGQLELTEFDAGAFNLDGARLIHPVSASYAVADISMPAIRYLVNPDKPPLASVERVG